MGKFKFKFKDIHVSLCKAPFHLIKFLMNKDYLVGRTTCPYSHQFSIRIKQDSIQGQVVRDSSCPYEQSRLENSKPRGNR
jgi:hypothetical protein